jgi:O-antigen ligase
LDQVSIAFGDDPISLPGPYASRPELPLYGEGEAVKRAAPGLARGSKDREAIRMKGSYAGLLLFLVIYCARPEDWIPGTSVLRLAMIAGILALIGALFGLGQRPAAFLHMLKDAKYLLLIFAWMCFSIPFSPVWRGGAASVVFQQFSKIVLIAALTILCATTVARLRWMILAQTLSILGPVLVVLWKHQADSAGRLSCDFIGGMYANPNDLAFLTVLIIPFCLAFALSASNIVKQLAWVAALLILIYTTVSTGSRGGFLALTVALAVCMWEMGVKAKRYFLVFLAGAACVAILIFGGGAGYRQRLATIFHPETDVTGSAQARQELMGRSVDIALEHPLFGVGAGNFGVVSGNWHGNHNTYLQFASEAGIPAGILFLLMLWQTLRNVREAKRRAIRNRHLQLLTSAMQASFLGFLVGAFFADMGYHFFPYILVAYTIAARNIAEREARELRQGERAAADSFGRPVPAGNLAAAPR